MRVFLLLCLVLWGSSSFAKTYIDAYRVDKDGKTHEMYQVEIGPDFSYVWIDEITSKVPWHKIKRIIVLRESKDAGGGQRRDSITLEMVDGRVFEDVRSDSSYRFSKYLAIDPISGEKVVKDIGYPKEGSVIIIGDVSNGTRKDSLGKIWPSYYLYSPITGECLSNMPKHQ